MRIGLISGIAGDRSRLEAALSALGDCERVVSLGNLIDAPSAGDAALLAHAATLAPRLVVMAGPGERARARDRRLPQAARRWLAARMPASVEAGIALLAFEVDRKVAHPSPRLVAPLSVSGGCATRLWRERERGLARVEALCGGRLSLRPGERVRIEVGPCADGAAVVLDLDARTVELRAATLAPADLPAAAGAPRWPALAAAAPRRPSRRRREVLVAQQQLLAV